MEAHSKIILQTQLAKPDGLHECAVFEMGSNRYINFDKSYLRLISAKFTVIQSST